MKKLVLISAMLLALAAVLSFSGCAVNPVVVIEKQTGNISVQNLSGHEVATVYICTSGSRSWGSNVLSSTTLDNGDLVTVGDLPTGHYDLYAETASGNLHWEQDNTQLTEDGFTWKIR